MERLTVKQVIQNERECVARKQCDRNCAKCDLVMDAKDILTSYDHVLEFLDAEEQGLLVRLPCKVGDTVYSPRKHDILEQTVDFVTVERDEVYISVSFYCDCDCDGCPHNNWQTTHEGEGYCDGENGSGLFTPKDFGKIVFLTREGALAKEEGEAK